jgi:hypothetical protein
MIRLTCTSCKQLLTIDDAFAGGVCRCQYCGTIQTVPSKLKAAAAAAGGASGNAAKSLYQNPAATGQSGSSLENLAEIVSSSGLAGSGLSSMTGGRRKQPAAKTPPAGKNKMIPLLIIGGAVIAILLAVVVVLLMRGGSSTPPANTSDASSQSPSPGPTDNSSTPDQSNGSPNGSPSGSPSPATAGPNFCQIPIDGQTIIYVLDNGSGTKDVFEDLLDATLRSAASLGKDRRFRVMFWDHDNGAPFPASGYSPADPDSIESARSALTNAVAYGSTEPVAAVNSALLLRPDRIILVTAKSWELDDSVADQVAAIDNGLPTKIDTIAIGGSSNSKAFREIAAKTGGRYKELTSGDLTAPPAGESPANPAPAPAQ